MTQNKQEKEGKERSILIPIWIVWSGVILIIGLLGYGIEFGLVGGIRLLLAIGLLTMMSMYSGKDDITISY